MTAETTFDSTQDTLENLLSEINNGKLQLPDFQRGWVWDDQHIKSVIASVSRSFPVGAIMTLRTGGEVKFQPRAVEGVTFDGEAPAPERLILDGQQRLTSLYQALTLKRPIRTRNDKRRAVDVWYYVDMEKALGEPQNREDAIISVPHDKIVRGAFGHEVLDLSTPDKEYEHHFFPLNSVFATQSWRRAWNQFWDRDPGKAELWDEFEEHFVQTFRAYQIPIIELRKSASKEAVCLVFEKVNTGGVSLTAFELLTATYAADNYNLREDWYGDPKRPGETGRAKRMAEARPLLQALESTDFLQAVTLLHTYERRLNALAEGRTGREVPAVSCTRQSLLDLPLDGYLAHADRAEEGFMRAARFLWREKIFSRGDIPYRTQLVPLAAILMALGDRWENDAVRWRVRQWYWCGVFGELYGSAIETRFANDLVEVLSWITDGGRTPTTVEEANFVSDRLRTLRTRQSAAYKGLHALIMQQGGAYDWRTGSGVDEQTYFDEAIDIHHIFPRAWCDKQGIDRNVYNSIVNKTALSAATNRMVGGNAPSAYLPRLQQAQGISAERMNQLLESHLIEPTRLRADDFDGLLVARGRELLRLIEETTGRDTGGPPIAEVFEVRVEDDGYLDVEEEDAA